MLSLFLIIEFYLFFWRDDFELESVPYKFCPYFLQNFDS